MRVAAFLMVALVIAPVLAQDDVKKDANPDVKPEAKADVKKDWSDLSRLIHQMVLKELPKEIEDKRGWGELIPLTEPLRFPNLPRTRVKKADKEGYPHGLWKKYKIRVDEPDKNLKIVVQDLSKIDPKNYRLAIDADAALIGDGELQNWNRGLRLGQVTGIADASLGLGMIFHVGISLDTKKFPPSLIVNPKLEQLKVDLKDVNVRKVAAVGGIVELSDETAKSMGPYMKDTLQSLITSLEPRIKDLANSALANALKEGKGNISAAALFKVAPAPKEKDKGQ